MISGRELLEVANFLESMNGEASARTRTGRAYYAVFLEARLYCERHHNHVRKKSGREHGDIPRLLNQIDPDLSADLAFLRKLRNVAEYETDVSGDTIKRQATSAKNLAYRILARLDRLTSETASGPATIEASIDDDDRPVLE